MVKQYEGEFKEGKYNGKGKQYNENGDLYIRKFLNGEYYGEKERILEWFKNEKPFENPKLNEDVPKMFIKENYYLDNILKVIDYEAAESEWSNILNKKDERKALVRAVRIYKKRNIYVNGLKMRNLLIHQKKIKRLQRFS